MQKTLITLVTTLSLSVAALAQQEEIDPKLTEVWEPEPAVVTFDEKGIPSDAIILLSPKGHAFEASGGGEMPWDFKDGVLTVKAKTGLISSKQKFGDIQLHLEWRSPAKIEGKTGQQVGNSGVFLQRHYEVQVLDSHENRTYSNGQATSIYKQHAPLVNATKPSQTWQTYDIIYKAPKFNDDDSLKSPAFVTVMHNGVLVQNHTEIQGATTFRGQASYKAHGRLPLELQDHGNPVSFRNIWVREIK